MAALLNLAGDMVFGAFAIAALSAVLLTLLILGLASHPLLAALIALLVAGGLSK